ncbi:Rho GTPase-activating protein 27 (CIN85-associated multi-domain-containing Rho GTPase-activating protein 1) (Rho-type GTPase-activating protein 27) (SH3 domain-containing protein 20) [Durusdinium trenchii]|uniref:Rho GTPase-activating protein 27 (CIN85-associated multi-domain-containing Rho GTPase-activating protein 1) (Rho-type GTPase-activating protein 27) (SH3 domain-containing protein 20) n=1 Tax=Durusdinium trenchii TaxID=1381693 RepID=A0ABP0IV80_9DINO
MLVFGTTVVAGGPSGGARAGRRTRVRDADRVLDVFEDVQDGQDDVERRKSTAADAREERAGGREDRRGRDGTPKGNRKPAGRRRRTRRPGRRASLYYREPEVAKSRRQRLRDLEREEMELLAKLEATRTRMQQTAHIDPDRQVLDALDMVPPLTEQGAGAFETGLQEDAQRRHELPVFVMPQIDRQVEVVRKLPRAPTEEEKERLREDEEAKAEARALLGLTDEEIRMFEQEGSSNQDESRHIFSPTAEATSGSNAKDVGHKRKRPGRGKRGARPKANSRSSKSKSNQIIGTQSNNRLHDDERARLRAELRDSLQSVASLSRRVQGEISALRNQFPSTASAAALKTQRYWALARLEAVLDKLQGRRLSSGFAQWLRATKTAKLADRRVLYHQMQSTAKLTRIVARLQRRKLAAAMRQWVLRFQFERNNEEYLAMSRASVTVQRVFRGHLGRERFARLRREADLREQSAAAAKLQSIFRGRHGRKRADVLKEKAILHAAARRLQRNWRARLARRRAAQRRLERQAQQQAALKVQTAWRRKQGMMGYHLLRQARREAAVAKMQAVQRKRLAQRRVAKERASQRQKRACIMVQRQYRMRLARRRLGERKIVVAKEREQQEMVALRLQAIFRGRRGRLVYQLKQQAQRARLEQDHQAISKIQSVFRGKVGRKQALQRKREHLQELCTWAKTWVEHFDDAAQDYVFLNQYTQEVLYEPPPDGYVTRDGQLALLDGRVVEDPEVAERREREKHLLKCIECEETVATRKCSDCDDIYCDTCYESVHTKGKLAEHTFEWFQDGKPTDFGHDEFQLQQSSSNPYYSDPSASGTVHQESLDGSGYGQEGGEDEWMELFDEDSGLPYWYNNWDGTTTWEPPFQASAASTTASATVAATLEWTEYFDEDSGLPYWYNASTGETTWEDPSGAAGAATDDASASEEWTEYIDESTGTPYLYNAATGETRWA